MSSGHTSADICFICKRNFAESLKCSRCDNIAHLACLSKKDEEEHTCDQANWQCKGCRQEKVAEVKKSSSEIASISNDSDPEKPELFSVLPYPDAVGKRLANLSLSDSGSKSGGAEDNGQYRFAHQNVNGIRSKFVDVCEVLARDKKIIVLAITECRLTENSRDYMIPSFHPPVRIDRLYKQAGGGQLVYVRDTCEYKRITFRGLTSPPPLLMECNFLSIKKAGMPTTILCVIYIPPKSVRVKCLKFFAEVCEKLANLKTKPRIVIAGDFNINWLGNCGYKIRLEQISKAFGFKQIVTKVTRRKSGTSLDHIYVKEEDGNAECDVIAGVESSDHDLTWMAFK